jgi:DNA-directed RNA polymerase subunit M/transcription elongation factor TFIIS
MTPEQHYRREVRKRGGSLLAKRKRTVDGIYNSNARTLRCRKCGGTKLHLSEIRTSGKAMRRSRTARCTKCGHTWRSLSTEALDA